MGSGIFKAIFDDGYTDKILVGSITGVILAVLPKLSPPAVGAVYAFGIAIPLGMQAWVSFVAGPTMIRHLERQTFSDIQSRLFPKFGLIGTSGSMIALVAQQLLAGQGLGSMVSKVLLANLLGNVLNTGLLFPKQISALAQMRDATNDDDKARFRKTFGMFHGISMLVNFSAFAMNCWMLSGVGGSVAKMF
ncbi:hypothetical protein TCAL_16843 [Tigriopus californicus]|uniref:TMEM205-like domain-containing protein n=1 Tax=Tigriopus californicus TaxID=6832 RepID=A0A553PDY7_TIGCA|nr:hypothetical protein TCAL_16843 [Tigriopus californicus]